MPLHPDIAKLGPEAELICDELLVRGYHPRIYRVYRSSETQELSELSMTSEAMREPGFGGHDDEYVCCTGETMIHDHWVVGLGNYRYWNRDSGFNIKVRGTGNTIEEAFLEAHFRLGLKELCE